MSNTSVTYQPKNYVTLTDDELAALDGACRPEVQEKVTAALSRLAAQSTHPDLAPPLAGLVADVLAEATKSGLLRHWHRQLRHCPLCGKRAGYGVYKSGPRRGQDNYDRPLNLRGIELADRFISVQGSVTLGGCVECMATVRPVLVEALRGVPVELPDQLVAEGDPQRRRRLNRHCKKCDWTGHEGQMKWDRTLMGNGRFPSRCPQCGAGGALSHDVEIAEGFVVVASSPSPTEEEQ